jgi:hypothetical protein
MLMIARPVHLETTDPLGLPLPPIHTGSLKEEIPIETHCSVF